MERERLLSHLFGEDRPVMARVLDGAEQALARAEPVWTDFLDPRLRGMAEDVLRQVPAVKSLAYGGYRGAERQRLVVVPSFYLTESIEPALEFLRIRPVNASELTHRDVLGALTGLGLRREKLGDILITPEEAQAIVAREVADVIFGQLSRVGNTQVQVGTMDPEELAVPPERVKEIKSTVPSLRLDAVAGLGYGVSRTRMVREIKSERLKVNWQIVRDPDHQVKVGDVLSMRGRGRVIVREITGQSKKGRIGIILQRLY
ncbi:MAG TPA: photosystem II S4 domain protein [Firmicutes bacterium]|jgi:RNA-binding protein YlmH|nr:photosystem II S4 domain protein [Bacillota bacterium]HOQ23372.1 YlmH/Sll1252 family protein [Bacillota bacterium]HPT66790.1 YlmH/Sll1252 family protein [Bacillota bacterium]